MTPPHSMLLREYGLKTRKDSLWYELAANTYVHQDVFQMRMWPMWKLNIEVMSCMTTGEIIVYGCELLPGEK